MQQICFLTVQFWGGGDASPPPSQRRRTSVGGEPVECVSGVNPNTKPVEPGRALPELGYPTHLHTRQPLLFGDVVTRRPRRAGQVGVLGGADCHRPPVELQSVEVAARRRAWQNNGAQALFKTWSENGDP